MPRLPWGAIVTPALPLLQQRSGFWQRRTTQRLRPSMHGSTWWRRGRATLPVWFKKSRSRFTPSPLRRSKRRNGPKPPSP